MDTTERVIILLNPKTHYTYRVTVTEDKEESFKKLMESNGYKFTKTSEYKQQSIVINLDKEIRNNK